MSKSSAAKIACIGSAANEDVPLGDTAKLVNIERLRTASVRLNFSIEQLGELRQRKTGRRPPPMKPTGQLDLDALIEQVCARADQVADLSRQLNS